MSLMRRSLLLLTFVCIYAGPCLAMDWKLVHEKADKTLLVDITKDPVSLEDQYLLGLVYLNARRDKEAADVFKKMLEISPQETVAKWGVAEVLRRQHKLDDSENILEEILILSPGFAPAMISRAYIRYLKMDFDGAARYAQRAINLGSSKLDLSNYVRAYLMLGAAKGMLAYHGGIFSKIIDGLAVSPALKKAESMQPYSAEVLFGMGNFYLLAPKIAGGNIDKAIRYLEMAVERDPLFPDTYARLAQAYRIKGDEDKYAACFTKAVELDPQNELVVDIESGSCKFICPKG
jgi:tetratricopeptide (TPR) repeat protein